MMTKTSRRLSDATPEATTREILRRTAASIRWHAHHPERIDRRLHQLDAEWDIERVLAANTATLSITGALLGAFVDRRFLAIPVVAGGSLLQHVLRGWCPMVPVLRSQGVRTMREIGEERYALKALRGDFGQMGPVERSRDDRASHALQAARM